MPSWLHTALLAPLALGTYASVSGDSAKDLASTPCVDLQPPWHWRNPTCRMQLRNTVFCKQRREGNLNDGICSKTCGVCSPTEDNGVSETSAACVDLQPESEDGANITCKEAIERNPGFCDSRRSRVIRDGLCQRTCNLCSLLQTAQVRAPSIAGFIQSSSFTMQLNVEKPPPEEEEEVEEEDDEQRPDEESEDGAERDTAPSNDGSPPVGGSHLRGAQSVRSDAHQQVLEKASSQAVKKDSEIQNSMAVDSEAQDEVEIPDEPAKAPSSPEGQLAQAAREKAKFLRKLLSQEKLQKSAEKSLMQTDNEAREEAAVREALKDQADALAEARRMWRVVEKQEKANKHLAGAPVVGDQHS